MQIVDVKLSDLKPYKRNAKTHPAEQVEHIANSLREFGWKQPIVIDKDNVIVCGHGRLLAAKSLGWETAPCVYADDLTDEQTKAFRLADNKTAESDWDFDFLTVELDDICDIDMTQFGFDLGDDEEPEPEIIEDDVPEEVDTRAKLGDIWQLGDHRLICGDCTDIGVIDRLIDNTEIDLLLTDPPYGINVVQTNKVGGAESSTSKTYGKVGGGIGLKVKPTPQLLATIQPIQHGRIMTLL